MELDPTKQVVAGVPGGAAGGGDAVQMSCAPPPARPWPQAETQLSPPWTLSGWVGTPLCPQTHLEATVCKYSDEVTQRGGAPSLPDRWI